MQIWLSNLEKLPFECNFNFYPQVREIDRLDQELLSTEVRPNKFWLLNMGFSFRLTPKCCIALWRPAEDNMCAGNSWAKTLCHLEFLASRRNRATCASWVTLLSRERSRSPMERDRSPVRGRPVGGFADARFKAWPSRCLLDNHDVLQLLVGLLESAFWFPFIFFFQTFDLLVKVKSKSNHF